MKKILFLQLLLITLTSFAIPLKQSLRTTQNNFTTQMSNDRLNHRNDSAVHTGHNDANLGDTLDGDTKRQLEKDDLQKDTTQVTIENDNDYGYTVSYQGYGSDGTVIKDTEDVNGGTPKGYSLGSSDSRLVKGSYGAYVQTSDIFNMKVHIDVGPQPTSTVTLDSNYRQLIKYQEALSGGRHSDVSYSINATGILTCPKIQLVEHWVNDVTGKVTSFAIGQYNVYNFYNTDGDWAIQLAVLGVMEAISLGIAGGVATAGAIKGIYSFAKGFREAAQVARAAEEAAQVARDNYELSYVVNYFGGGDDEEGATGAVAHENPGLENPQDNAQKPNDKNTNPENDKGNKGDKDTGAKPGGDKSKPGATASTTSSNGAKGASTESQNIDKLQQKDVTTIVNPDTIDPRVRYSLTPADPDHLNSPAGGGNPEDTLITNPTGTSRTGTSPTGSSPTGSSPTGSSPTGSSPTGSSSTGSSPTGSSPTGSSPTGAGSAGAGTAGTTPTPSGATPTPSGATPTPSGATPTPSGATPTPSGATPTPSGARPTSSGATPTPSGATSTGATPINASNINPNGNVGEITSKQPRTFSKVSGERNKATYALNAKNQEKAEKLDAELAKVKNNLDVLNKGHNNLPKKILQLREEAQGYLIDSINYQQQSDQINQELADIGTTLLNNNINPAGIVDDADLEGFVPQRNQDEVLDVNNPIRNNDNEEANNEEPNDENANNEEEHNDENANNEEEHNDENANNEENIDDVSLHLDNLYNEEDEDNVSINGEGDGEDEDNVQDDNQIQQDEQIIENAPLNVIDANARGRAEIKSNLSKRARQLKNEKDKLNNMHNTARWKMNKIKTDIEIFEEQHQWYLTQSTIFKNRIKSIEERIAILRDSDPTSFSGSTGYVVTKNAQHDVDTAWKELKDEEALLASRISDQKDALDKMEKRYYEEIQSYRKSLDKIKIAKMNAECSRARVMTSMDRAGTNPNETTYHYYRDDRWNPINVGATREMHNLERAKSIQLYTDIIDECNGNISILKNKLENATRKLNHVGFLKLKLEEDKVEGFIKSIFNVEQLDGDAIDEIQTAFNSEPSTRARALKQLYPQRFRQTELTHRFSNPRLGRAAINGQIKTEFPQQEDFYTAADNTTTDYEWEEEYIKLNQIIINDTASNNNSATHIVSSDSDSSSSDSEHEGPRKAPQHPIEIAFRDVNANTKKMIENINDQLNYLSELKETLNQETITIAFKVDKLNNETASDIREWEMSAHKANFARIDSNKEYEVFEGQFKDAVFDHPVERASLTPRDAVQPQAGAGLEENVGVQPQAGAGLEENVGVQPQAIAENVENEEVFVRYELDTGFIVTTNTSELSNLFSLMAEMDMDDTSWANLDSTKSFDDLIGGDITPDEISNAGIEIGEILKGELTTESAIKIDEIREKVTPRFLKEDSDKFKIKESLEKVNRLNNQINDSFGADGGLSESKMKEQLDIISRKASPQYYASLRFREITDETFILDSNGHIVDEDKPNPDWFRAEGRDGYAGGFDADRDEEGKVKVPKAINNGKTDTFITETENKISELKNKMRDLRQDIATNEGTIGVLKTEVNNLEFKILRYREYIEAENAKNAEIERLYARGPATPETLRARWKHTYLKSATRYHGSTYTIGFRYGFNKLRFAWRTSRLLEGEAGITAEDLARDSFSAHFSRFKKVLFAKRFGFEEHEWDYDFNIARGKGVKARVDRYTLMLRESDKLETLAFQKGGLGGFVKMGWSGLNPTEQDRVYEEFALEKFQTGQELSDKDMAYVQKEFQKDMHNLRIKLNKIENYSKKVDSDYNEMLKLKESTRKLYIETHNAYGEILKIHGDVYNYGRAMDLGDDFQSTGVTHETLNSSLTYSTVSLSTIKVYISEIKEMYNEIMDSGLSNWERSKINDTFKKDQKIFDHINGKDDSLFPKGATTEDKAKYIQRLIDTETGPLSSGGLRLSFDSMSKRKLASINASITSEEIKIQKLHDEIDLLNHKIQNPDPIIILSDADKARQAEIVKTIEGGAKLKERLMSPVNEADRDIVAANAIDAQAEELTQELQKIDARSQRIEDHSAIPRYQDKVKKLQKELKSSLEKLDVYKNFKIRYVVSVERELRVYNDIVLDHLSQMRKLNNEIITKENKILQLSKEQNAIGIEVENLKIEARTATDEGREDEASLIRQRIRDIKQTDLSSSQKMIIKREIDKLNLEITKHKQDLYLLKREAMKFHDARGKLMSFIDDNEDTLLNTNANDRNRGSVRGLEEGENSNDDIMRRPLNNNADAPVDNLQRRANDEFNRRSTLENKLDEAAQDLRARREVTQMILSKRQGLKLKYNQLSLNREANAEALADLETKINNVDEELFESVNYYIDIIKDFNQMKGEIRAISRRLKVDSDTFITEIEAKYEVKSLDEYLLNLPEDFMNSRHFDIEEDQYDDIASSLSHGDSMNSLESNNPINSGGQIIEQTDQSAAPILKNTNAQGFGEANENNFIDKESSDIIKRETQEKLEENEAQLLFLKEVKTNLDKDILRYQTSIEIDNQELMSTDRQLSVENTMRQSSTKAEMAKIRSLRERSLELNNRLEFTKRLLQEKLDTLQRVENDITLIEAEINSLHNTLSSQSRTSQYVTAWI